MQGRRLGRIHLVRAARSLGLLLVFGLAFALPVDAQTQVQPPAAQAPGATPWERIADDDGIAVYRREVAGSPLIAFKGEGVVDASILRVASVLVDSARATEWIDSLVEARVLRELSETETIHYDHVATPIVMKDRDFVSDCKLEFDPAQKKVAVRIHSVSDSSAPTTSYIRGELLNSAFVLTSIEHGAKTRVVAEIHADPKGSVAKWIVNLFQKRWPHNTITGLRAQVAKTNIREHPRLKQVLSENGYLN